MKNLSKNQRNILCHTLGGGTDPKKWFRNHFVAHVNHNDYGDLIALERFGFMVRVKTPTFCHSEDLVYQVTSEGKKALLSETDPMYTSYTISAAQRQRLSEPYADIPFHNSDDMEDPDYTKNVVCPWCGYEDMNSWELDDDGTTECSRCEQPFAWETERLKKFKTWKIKGKS